MSRRRPPALGTGKAGVKGIDGNELSGTRAAASDVAVNGALEHKPSLVLDDRTRDLIEARRNGSTHRRGWIVRRALIVADTVGILAAFGIAEMIFHSNAVIGRYGSLAEIGLFVASLPAWLLLAKVYGLYDSDEERADHSTADEVFSVLNMLVVGTFGFYAVAYLVPGLTAIPLGKILTFLAFAIPLVVLARAVARVVCKHTDAYTQNTLIVGAGDVGQHGRARSCSSIPSTA